LKDNLEENDERETDLIEA